MPHPIWMRLRVHYFVFAVEHVQVQVQVQVLPQLHEAQSHLAQSHLAQSHLSQSHLSQSQDVPHEQAGVHEQDAFGLTSLSIFCVFIEDLVLGLTR
ncbi:MAG: hypothetical protein ABI035_03255 [Gemmatimonadaceae bacterium]